MNLKDKRILVAGADGFIGSHLTGTLLDMGCDGRALSLYNSFNDWGWLEVIKGREKLDVVCGDVRDLHFFKSPNKNPMTHHLGRKAWRKAPS